VNRTAARSGGGGGGGSALGPADRMAARSGHLGMGALVGELVAHFARPPLFVWLLTLDWGGCRCGYCRRPAPPLAFDSAMAAKVAARLEASKVMKKAHGHVDGHWCMTFEDPGSWELSWISAKWRSVAELNVAAEKCAAATAAAATAAAAAAAAAAATTAAAAAASAAGSGAAAGGGGGKEVEKEDSEEEEEKEKEEERILRLAELDANKALRSACTNLRIETSDIKVEAKSTTKDLLTRESAEKYLLTRKSAKEDLLKRLYAYDRQMALTAAAVAGGEGGEVSDEDDIYRREDAALKRYYAGEVGTEEMFESCSTERWEWDGSGLITVLQGGEGCEDGRGSPDLDIIVKRVALLSSAPP
jgi:hypothetical protein